MNEQPALETWKAAPWNKSATTAKAEPHVIEEEWLKARRTGIGASSAGVIMGMIGSPMKLWAQMVGLEPKQQDNDAMRYGRLFESAIAEDYHQRTGYLLLDHGRYTIHRSTDNPILTATLDREIVDHPLGPAVLEIKTGGLAQLSKWEDGEAPLQYVAQVQHQLYVMGPAYRHGVIFAVIGGQKPFMVDVPRDDAFIEALVKACTKFWKHVQDETPPPIDASKDAEEVIRRLYPRDKGQTVTLGIDAVDWTAEIESLDEQLEKLEAKKQFYRNNLLAAIGDATKAVLPNGDGSWTWKLQQRKEYTVKASESRVLRRSKSNGK